MCGITAIYAYQRTAPPVDQGELLRIRDAMERRGPDGAGIWIAPDNRVGLAHRRLSIIDLSDAGTQPMATPDRKLQIVFNGEIYNYRELRTRLQAKGHVFLTHSDTEVLLYAWREYGQAMVEHLRGMYAFSIWDEDRKGLFLARDHFGIKPLYYHDDGKTFRIASQVKALLSGGGIEARPEPAGHVGFYLWGCVPEPYTLYRNLFALPAGHTLWVDGSGPRVPLQYFDIAQELENASSVKPEKKPSLVLREALRDSVRHHLISDVPVGVFLSSGIDSATLLALSAESLGSKLQAVTLGFAEYENTLADEVPLARKIAAQYACDHHIGRITKSDFDEDLGGILRAMDQPSIDGVNTWFVAREAKRAGLKVALSGLGGDELLGGYPSFRQIPGLVSCIGPIASLPGLGKAMRLVSAPIIKHLSSSKYASLFEYGGSYGGAYLLRRGLFMPWELPHVLDGELVREGWAKLQPVLRLDEWTKRIHAPHTKVAALEMSFYMRNTLLRDSDWAGMAHSLEIRVPLVDVTLFRALAPHLASTDPPTKHYLGRVPKYPLSSEFINRPKTGFTIPVREWVEKRVENQEAQKAVRSWRGFAKMVMTSNFFPSHAQPPKRPRILIFRIGSLGDTCVAIPSFRLIRQRFPDAEIRVLTNFPVDKGIKAAPLQSVIGASGLVDGYFEYSLGLEEGQQVLGLRRELRQWKPDLLVYMMPVRNRKQLLRDYLFFRFFIGIPRVVGLNFSVDAQHHLVDNAQHSYESEAQRLLRNLSTEGDMDLQAAATWDLALQPAEINSANAHLDGWPGTRRFIACSIGAKWDTKQWGTDRWKEWAMLCSANNPDLGLVLIGSASEEENSACVAQHWRGPTLNLCGKSLQPRESAAIIARAACFIGHDSGPMHLAAAVGTSCVAIFSAQDKPGVWFPYGNQHRIIYHMTECYGCKLEFCTDQEKKCIRSITVAEVIEQTKQLLNINRFEA